MLSIPNEVETHVAFGVEEYPVSDVRQLASNLFKIIEAGAYTVSAGLRYEHPGHVGPRELALGNELTRDQAGARRWIATGARTDTDETSLAVSTTRRFEAGNRIAAWTIQGPGPQTSPTPVVEHATGYVSMSIARTTETVISRTGSLQTVNRNLAPNGDFQNGGADWSTGGDETAPSADHRRHRPPVGDPCAGGVR